MSSVELVATHCPYCGEPIQLLVDCSAGDQDYVEDCQVCCRPLHIQATVDMEGDPQVIVQTEDD